MVSTSSIIFSWPRWPSLAESHPDFLDFLRSTRLLYSLRGFEHTPELNEPALPFEYSEDGHPLIRVEGEWTRWEEVKEFGLRYDANSRTLLDQAEEEWNYIPALGLAKTNRYNHIYSICRLSEAAMQALGNSVPKKPEEIDNRCYIQLITDGASRASRIDHIALRLISQEGEVYSFGFETAEPLNINFSLIPNLLASRSVHISSQDFREFKHFRERPTTTLSLSNDQFNKALERVGDLMETPQQFNLLRQNCVSFAADVMHAAGIEVDTHRYPLEMLYDLLPYVEDIPYIGCFLARIKEIAETAFFFLSACIPSPIKTAFRWTVHAITYVPLKILTVLRNILLLSLGASSADLEEHSLMPCWWKDLWSDEVGLIASPLALVDWQDRQMKDYTYIHKYENSPKLFIVPPKPEPRTAL